jgi:putative aminopeptidase FrvX
LADTAEPYFELWYQVFDENASIPKFKSIAKKAENDLKNDLVVYYTDACPFNDYYVNTELKQVAEKRNIPLQIKKLKTREEAQNHFVPHTLYSVFYNGKFITQHILNDKYFDRFIKK